MKSIMLLKSKISKGFGNKVSKPLEKRSFSISLGNSKNFQNEQGIRIVFYIDYQPIH